MESFPAKEANYGKALDYLKKRLGKESALIRIYVRELLKLVITDKTQVNLLTLYDKLQTQLCAVQLNAPKFKKFVCIFCNKFHNLENCNEALSMSLDSKRDIL